MWETLVDRLPTGMEILCTFLAFFVPFLVYTINQKLHQEMDPSWKNSDSEDK
ncbi:hypothetical protein [Oceanobacillus sp. FSL W7-1309]|uniref:hypothetical protein n=1 Tax=Oceanobacillus sp. FSL W7-1309 TaxID=2954539 RepID=UPI0030F727E3